MSYQLHTSKSWSETIDELALAFERWGVSPHDWAVRPSRPQTRKTWPTVDERRVTVEFRHPSGKPITLTTDGQQLPQDNLRAIYLTIEDMRMIERRGLGELMRSAYLQIAAPAAARTWRAVLELGEESRPMREWIEAAYRRKAKELHPDAGGSDEAFRELQRARDEALAELEGNA
jgi:hypothetical protein